MKLFIFIIVIFCCLKFVNCLKCVDNIHGSSIKNSDCDENDKFCFEITYKVKAGVEKEGTFQGCSNELSAYGASCARTGNTPYSGNGYRGTLDCCDSDLCNSATTYSFFGISVFILITKFMLL